MLQKQDFEKWRSSPNGTKLEYITSSGMRLFLDLLKVAKSKGSKCTLVGLNNDIYEVFNEVGFINLFDVRQTL